MVDRSLATLLAALALFLVLANLSVAQTRDIPNLMCSEVYSDKNFTETTGLMLTWLSGYRDGIAALSALDDRLQKLPNFDQIGSLVLAICTAKPDQSVGETATDVFQALINALPGERLKLALPGK